MKIAQVKAIVCGLASCVVIFSTGCSSTKTANEVGGPAAAVNGDFETGKLAPWAVFQSVQADISTVKVHKGGYSLAESQGKGGSVYEDLRGLLPGTEYVISVWMAGDTGGTATAQIAAWDPGANVATASAPILAAPEWKMLQHKVKLTGAGPLRVHLVRNAGTGTIFWDDVEVSPANK